MGIGSVTYGLAAGDGDGWDRVKQIVWGWRGRWGGPMEMEMDTNHDGMDASHHESHQSTESGAWAKRLGISGVRDHETQDHA